MKQETSYVKVNSIMPWFRYAVGPISQHSPAIPYFTRRGAEACFNEMVRELPWCGCRLYKRTWRGLRVVREYTPNPIHLQREQWRDCCDCIRERDFPNERCDKCSDDPARPDWVAKWANQKESIQ